MDPSLIDRYFPQVPLRLFRFETELLMDHGINAIESSISLFKSFLAMDRR